MHVHAFIILSLYTVPHIVLILLQVKHRRSELLKHELVSTFLRQKFTKFRMIFYLADFFLYALFLIFLTSYALTVPTPLDDICELMLTVNMNEKFFFILSPINILLILCPGTMNASKNGSVNGSVNASEHLFSVTQPMCSGG